MFCSRVTWSMKNKEHIGPKCPWRICIHPVMQRKSTDKLNNIVLQQSKEVRFKQIFIINKWSLASLIVCLEEFCLRYLLRLAKVRTKEKCVLSKLNTNLEFGFQLKTISPTDHNSSRLIYQKRQPTLLVDKFREYMKSKRQKSNKNMCDKTQTV